MNHTLNNKLPLNSRHSNHRFNNTKHTRYKVVIHQERILNMSNHL